MIVGSVDRSNAATAASGFRNRRAIVVCDPWLGSNGFAGMKALRRAGWSVRVVAEWEYVPVKWRTPMMRALGRAIRHNAVQEFNGDLNRIAREVDPAMLLVFKGTFVMRDTISALRGRGLRTYCFFPDVSAFAHGRYLPAALPAYDKVFTTKSFGIADLKKLGVHNPHFLLHAFDRDLHRPVSLNPEERARYGCDASFIGTWSPKKECILTGLKERLPSLDLRIWGAQWNRSTSSALVSAIAGRDVEGEEYVNAIAGSAVNIALLSERRLGASSGDLVTSRTFHIPAAGGFMLHERTEELLAIYAENESVACFGDLEELVRGIEYYLSEPEQRVRVAQAGRRVAQAAHSWDHRIQAILAHDEVPA